jgi:glycosyltransferase involved in cell wall biosynthesis
VLTLRILILVDCYLPSTKASGKLVHDLAVELRRRGHEPVVLTPSDAIEGTSQLRVEDGITVLRVRAGQIKGAAKLQRAIREARLSATLWRGTGNYLRENPCELILFYSPTIFFGPLVARLKKLWRCSAYMILRDIFPDWAVDAGVLRRGLIYRYFRRVAEAQYRAADLIAVQSESNRAHFATNFPGERFRIEVLLNWTAPVDQRRPSPEWRRRLGLAGKIVFFYGGNIGIAQDMDNLMRLAANFAANPNVAFLFVGEGSEVARLQKAIASRSITNVQILPSVAQDDYLAMVSEFDVGLISLDARLKSHNVPGKLMSYLNWGLPVLASLNPGNDLFALLESSGAGFCIRNGDDDGLFRLAFAMASDSALRATMSCNARRLLDETFSVANAVDSIFHHLASHSLLSLPPEARAVAHSGAETSSETPHHALAAKN